MSVFVDAARVIFSLGSLGEQFKGVGDSNYSGEYLASSITSMGADAAAGGIASYKMIQQYRLSQMNAADNTSLILKTVTVVDIAELMTGFGPPCGGADFTEGSQQLTEIYEQLRSALPDDDWQGSASEAYTEQVTTLRTLAQTMAGLDRELADIAKNQAEWVTHMRLAFGVLKDLLMVAFAVEVAIKLTVLPPASLTLAQNFALTVSVLGVAAAVSFLSTLIYYAHENAVKAKGVVSQYHDLAPKAVSTGTTSVEAKAPAAMKSTVSDFAAISRGMSGVFAGPDVATEARKAPEDASSKQSAPTGEGGTPGGRHERDEPGETTPSTPAVSAPTLASVTFMSGQAAPLDSGMGPTRRVASLTENRKSAAPAEETGFADDVEGAGAAWSAEGAGRAPVELAAVGGTGRHRVA
jgi:hypothetical protein